MTDKLKIGDTIELYCPNLLHNTRSNHTIRGKIVDLFDVLFEDGSEGNLEIDIASGSFWIRYKPSKDGGTVTLINKKD